ncbi:MAG: BPSS1187 family protein [Acidimicrobiales bacterium]
MTIAAGSVAPASAGHNADGTKKDKSKKNKSANVVLTPAAGVARQNLLAVFIPGTGLKPSDSTAFLDFASRQGYHVIGVAYDNKRSVATICRDQPDPCFGQVRREISFGEDASPLVNIGPDDSILGKVRSEVRRLAASSPSTDGWSGFLDKPSTPSTSPINTDQLAMIGHSQGAGHAAVIAQRFVVAQVGLMAGPNDVVGSEDEPPSWTLGHGNSAPAKWAAMTHRSDNGTDTQIKSWRNLNVPGNRQNVISGGTNNAHRSVVVDGSLTSNITTHWSRLLND